MNNGYLSQYFESVAVKRLSAVEVNRETSHQHEFNGSRALKSVLHTTERAQFETTFLWMEEQNEALSETGSVTWYDARERHPKRSEFRLYFPTNSVMEMATAGDTLFIARKTDNSLLIIITPSGSTMESQLYWLFGLSDEISEDFQLSVLEKGAHELDFASRFILEELGIEVEEPENDQLDNLLNQFGHSFPSTVIFSQFARSSFPDEINLIDDPDSALISFMDWEEKLFKRLERHIVANRLSEGFDAGDGQDVDGFISFSLSVQNRRKSRAGYAFEEHLSHILLGNEIIFSRKVETQNKAKPDFLFPNIISYRNTAYPDHLLTMLGAKTTCKDRWRQILPEADRISPKHLITLEPGISENQTSEMQALSVQLILPKGLHQTYTNSQQSWLIDLKSFITLVRGKQQLAHERGLFI